MSKIGQAVVSTLDAGYNMDEITNGQVELVTA